MRIIFYLLIKQGDHPDMNGKKLLSVIKFTILDELHNKSFYVLTLICMFFVFLLRGCFKSPVTFNGQQVDSVTVGWHASIAAFNIIASAGVLIAILLAMRVLRRDKDNGMLIAILSKPVQRLEYIAGKIIGLWILAYGLTLLLHLAVYIIMLINSGARIPLFIPASLVTSVNVLFAVSLVLLFSLIMPDFIAALSALGICIISLISDSIFAVFQNQGVQSMVGDIAQQQTSSIALWRIIWPKIVAVQYFSTSLITDTGFNFPGPVHPVVNILIYCSVIFGFLYLKFSKEELQ